MKNNLIAFILTITSLNSFAEVIYNGDSVTLLSDQNFGFIDIKGKDAQALYENAEVAVSDPGELAKKLSNPGEIKRGPGYSCYKIVFSEQAHYSCSILINYKNASIRPQPFSN